MHDEVNLFPRADQSCLFEANVSTLLRITVEVPARGQSRCTTFHEDLQRDSIYGIPLPLVASNFCISQHLPLSFLIHP